MAYMKSVRFSYSKKNALLIAYRAASCLGFKRAPLEEKLCTAYVRCAERKVRWRSFPAAAEYYSQAYNYTASESKQAELVGKVATCWVREATRSKIVQKRREAITNKTRGGIFNALGHTNLPREDMLRSFDIAHKILHHYELAACFARAAYAYYAVSLKDFSLQLGNALREYNKANELSNFRGSAGSEIIFEITLTRSLTGRKITAVKEDVQSIIAELHEKEGKIAKI